MEVIHESCCSSGGRHLAYQLIPRASSASCSTASFTSSVRLPPVNEDQLTRASSSSAGKESSGRVANSTSRESRLRKQLLEPVLTSKSDSLLTPRGGPPRLERSPKPSTSESAPTPAVQELTPVMPPGPCPVQARQRPRRDVRQALGFPMRIGHGDSSNPLAKTPPSRIAVSETIYCRDVMGKNGGVCRSTLASEVREHDAQLAEFAQYRSESQRAARQSSRRHAAKWRESSERRERIHECRWHLARSATFAQPHVLALHGVIDDPDDQQRLLPTPSLPSRVSPVPTPPIRRNLSPVHGPEELSTKTEVIVPPSAHISDSDHSNKPSHKSPRPNSGPPNPEHSSVQPASVRRIIALRGLCRRFRKRRKDKDRQKEAQNRQGNSLDGSPCCSAEVQQLLARKLRGITDELEDKSARMSHKRIPIMEILSERQDEQDLRELFNSYSPGHQGLLGRRELERCIAALGLRSAHDRERVEIRGFLDVAGDAGLRFPEFVKKVLPGVRKRLATINHGRLTELFRYLDIDEDGFISMQEVLRALRLIDAFTTETQALEIIADVAKKCAEKTRTFEGRWLMSKSVVDYNDFSQLLGAVSNRISDARRFEDLTLRCGLAKRLPELRRYQVVRAYDMLVSTFGEHACDVPRLAATTCMEEHGLVSLNPGVGRAFRQKIMVEGIQDAGISIPAILKALCNTHEEDDQRLLQAFKEHDSGGKGFLTRSERLCALSSFGVAAKNRLEQQELFLLSCDFDRIDTTGEELDWDGFWRLGTLATTRLHRLRDEMRRQFATESVETRIEALPPELSEAVEPERISFVHSQSVA